MTQISPQPTMHASSEDREVLVRVEGVSKKFCRNLKKSLWYGVQDIAAEVSGHKSNHELRPDEFWSVKDVSFELRRGECLGLIGHNGAGKTTLLKMLNGLIKPDRGRIEMNGRVGALIALGTGFNPILTGRENIYVNASVLGISKQEIEAKINDIIEFSEIGEFIDTPVQNYSSGMQVRLGFAVAINMQPDILLIDEVLAVGDIGFRVKCYNEIYRILKNTAVILVSHSMPQIGKVCKSGILMEGGKIDFHSQNIGEVILAYYNKFSHERASIEGNGKVIIQEIKFGNKKNPKRFLQPAEIVPTGILELSFEEGVVCEILCQRHPEVTFFSVLLSITDLDQKLVAQMKSEKYEVLSGSLTQIVKFELNSLQLNTGTYSLSIHLANSVKNAWDEVFIGLRNIIRFSIKRNDFTGSAPVIYNGKWSVSETL